MTFKTLSALGAMVLAIAACTPAEEPAAPAASVDGMKMDETAKAAPPAVPAGPIVATGKVVAIDAATGSVTLDHQAIPAVGWDAMSMAFTTTDPSLLKDLAVGDTVSFELKSATEKTVISKIQKQ